MSGRSGGECHYNPPTVVHDASDGRFDATWPRVGEYDWCGKFDLMSEDENESAFGRSRAARQRAARVAIAEADEDEDTKK